MTVAVLEHEGIYTAYRRIIRRGEDGRLYESVKRINLDFPPTDESRWPGWAMSLTPDELDAGLQIFFDRWNFGKGHDIERRIYDTLTDERTRRKLEDEHPMVVVNTKPIRVRE